MKLKKILLFLKNHKILFGSISLVALGLSSIPIILILKNDSNNENIVNDKPHINNEKNETVINDKVKSMESKVNDLINSQKLTNKIKDIDPLIITPQMKLKTPFENIHHFAQYSKQFYDLNYKEFVVDNINFKIKNRHKRRYYDKPPLYYYDYIDNPSVSYYVKLSYWDGLKKAWVNHNKDIEIKYSGFKRAEEKTIYELKDLFKASSSDLLQERSPRYHYFDHFAGLTNNTKGYKIENLDIAKYIFSNFDIGNITYFSKVENILNQINFNELNSKDNLPRIKFKDLDFLKCPNVILPKKLSRFKLSKTKNLDQILNGNLSEYELNEFHFPVGFDLNLITEFPRNNNYKETIFNGVKNINKLFAGDISSWKIEGAKFNDTNLDGKKVTKWPTNLKSIDWRSVVNIEDLMKNPKYELFSDLRADNHGIDALFNKSVEVSNLESRNRISNVVFDNTLNLDKIFKGDISNKNMYSIKIYQDKLEPKDKLDINLINKIPNKFFERLKIKGVNTDPLKKFLKGDLRKLSLSNVNLSNFINDFDLGEITHLPIENNFENRYYNDIHKLTFSLNHVKNGSFDKFIDNISKQIISLRKANALDSFVSDIAHSLIIYNKDSKEMTYEEKYQKLIEKVNQKDD